MDITYELTLEKINTPQEAQGPYCDVLLSLLSMFVDSQLAAAANFVDVFDFCPSVSDRVTAARVVLEKMDHADQFVQIMKEFGAETDKYMENYSWGARRERGGEAPTQALTRDKRNPVFDYPLLDWKDAMVWSVFVGHASNLQLQDLTKMSYAPAAELFEKITQNETAHNAVALESFHKYASDPANRNALQTSVDYWWPRVTASFGGKNSHAAKLLCEFGFRQHDNEYFRLKWVEDMSSLMREFGLSTGETLQSLTAFRKTLKSKPLKAAAE